MAGELALGRRWTEAPIVHDIAKPLSDIASVPAVCREGATTAARTSIWRLRGSLVATRREERSLGARHETRFRLVVPSLYAWKYPNDLKELRPLTERQRGSPEERIAAALATCGTRSGSGERGNV